MVESPPRRRRPRRGSLDRPISARLYRAAWTVVLVPVVVAAFTVGQPRPLPAPALPASFDQRTAVRLAEDLAQRFPDRRPGTKGGRGAAAWVVSRFLDFGLAAHRAPFTADVPGAGATPFENLFAIVPGASSQTVVVMAHRDNLGVSPGANDNASGTAALLELARNTVTPEQGRQTSLLHTLVFLSTDGGSYGEAGATAFARDPGVVTRLLAPGASVVVVVNLDALAGTGPPRLEFAGDTARTPTVSLLTTAAASVRAEAGAHTSWPSPIGQMIDLAFPFSLFGQAALVAGGIPAVTLTSGDGRPPSPYRDSSADLRRGQLGALGRAAQALLASLDQAADAVRGTDSYLYLGSRTVRGWTIQLVLLAALLPFLAATLELYARCRRALLPLAPAFRSMRSRVGVWAWSGGVFALLAGTGAFPAGDARPLSPDTAAANNWPVGALVALAVLSALGWLLARPRLLPTRDVDRSEEIAGHLAALLLLSVAALLVAATNPYSLLFVLPSLHAWLWVPNLEGSALRVRLGLYALGFAGPAVLIASFAVRFDLGLDAPWYVVALATVGYVPLTLVVAFFLWGAAAAQIGALAIGRYAPYPRPSERPRLGPIRRTIRHGVLAGRRRRALRER